MAANFAQQRGTKGGLFEREWFRHLDARQEVLRKTESSGPTGRGRRAAPLPPAKAWAPGDARTSVIIVTAPGGASRRSFATWPRGTRSCHAPLLATSTTPPPARRWHRSGERFDFGNAASLRAGRDPRPFSKEETARSVVRNDGHGGPRLRRRLAPGREITGAVRPAVHRVCWRRKQAPNWRPRTAPARRTPTGSAPLAANHAALTRGGDVTLTGFAGPVDRLPGRDALEGLTRRPPPRGGQTFRGGPDAAGRFVRPVVSFASADGVLRPWPSSKGGARRRRWRSRRTPTHLPRSTEPIAADGASTGALLVDEGRGGEALRVVRAATTASNRPTTK